jgi:hypothetical protein
MTRCNFLTAQGRELRALRTLKREAKSVFISFQRECTGLAKLIERAGIAAKIGFLSASAHAAPCGRLCLGKEGTDTCTLQA